MKSDDSGEFWTRAQQARDKLAARFLDHPAVSLIDIGYRIERGQMTNEIVLRIHVRERWLKAGPKELAAFPKQIDNIPVIVMPGNYQPEEGPGPEDEE